MVGKGVDGKARQIYACIREELYLAAKARAAELRIPLRKFLEVALEQALEHREYQPFLSPGISTSIWRRSRLQKMRQEPVGSSVDLTQEEAEAVVREAFGSGARSKKREEERLLRVETISEKRALSLKED